MSRRSSPPAKPFDLDALTRIIEVDNRISLSYYYGIADSLLKRAKVYRAEKNIADLYVVLVKFLSLVSETIPSHRDYPSSYDSKRSRYTVDIFVVMNELKALKPEFDRRVEAQNKAYVEAQRDQSKSVETTTLLLDGSQTSHTSSPPKTSSWSPTSGHYPPKRMDAEEYKDQCKMCAEKAMAYFNQSAIKQGGVTYEIMGYGKSSKMSGHEAENCWVFHCNFEARPQYYYRNRNREAKSNDESEMSLFFGELIKLDHDGPYVVTRCAILGPAGRVYIGIAGCDPVSRDAINHSTRSSVNLC